MVTPNLPSPASQSASGAGEAGEGQLELTLWTCPRCPAAQPAVFTHPLPAHHARALPARCHRCILAARSDYFRALLERATSEAGAVGGRAAGAWGQADPGSGQPPPLPQAVIGDVGAAAFETVLRFVYTDSIVAAARPRGGGQRGGAAAADPSSPAAAAAEPFAWKDADRAEELLFAADLFLLFSLKVRAAARLSVFDNTGFQLAHRMM